MAPKTAARSCLALVGGSLKHPYTADYVTFLCLLGVYLLIIGYIEPFHRMFSIGDLNISYPHAEVERVPVSMNFVYALYIPLGLQVLYLVVTRASFHKFHATVISIAIALVLTSVLTDTIKDAVGRPRPDLLARCKPAAGTPANTLVTIKICTETTHHTLHDGWRSFPSGHSSFAFAGLGQSSLWLCGQFRVFRREHHKGRLGGDVGRAILCLLPLLGAALIAISRCEDYRHDVYDVCAGSVLGFGIAHLSYRRWWPRLSAHHCDEPYPSPAAEDDERQGWGRVRDEEEAAEHEMPALGGSPP